MMIIDRFEGSFAVVEDNGVMINIPREILPEDAREGSVLIKNGDSYTVDTAETKSRKASIKSRFDALKKKK